MYHKLLTFNYLFLPSLINPSLLTSYFCNVLKNHAFYSVILRGGLYIYIYIDMYIYICVYYHTLFKGLISEAINLMRVFSRVSIIAERELTFRKRPSWKPQHLVTMYHKLLTFHYLFLPSLINLSLLTSYFCKCQKTLSKVIVNLRKYRKTLGKVRVYVSRC